MGFIPVIPRNYGTNTSVLFGAFRWSPGVKNKQKEKQIFKLEGAPSISSVLFGAPQGLNNFPKNFTGGPRGSWDSLRC